MIRGDVISAAPAIAARLFSMDRLRDQRLWPSVHPDAPARGHPDGAIPIYPLSV